MQVGFVAKTESKMNIQVEQLHGFNIYMQD